MRIPKSLFTSSLQSYFIISLDFGPRLLTAHGYINIFHTTRSPYLVLELFNPCINVLFATILTHRLCTLQVTAANIVLKQNKIKKLT